VSVTPAGKLVRVIATVAEAAAPPAIATTGDGDTASA
jgi:hypothetical protein